MQFLKNRFALVLSLLLACQAVGAYLIDKRAENTPVIAPLSTFPTNFAGWRMLKDYPLEDEVAKVLQATDTITRDYANTKEGVNLYIAYFKSQRSGVAPHSPKNCLPGNGWVSENQEIFHIDIPGYAPIEANRYVVQRAESKNVVLYWYQSRQRTVASEYKAKFFVIADAIQQNRTDTSLVRVIAPVFGGDLERANKAAIQFTQDMYPLLGKSLPQ